MFDSLVAIAVPAAGILILLIAIGAVFSRLYTRATKELAFVRTGMGGEKVVMDGGALVFPVLHEIIQVNMNTLRLVVTRRETNSLITKDKMRVDVQAEFYVRVDKTAESIAAAATTLGAKTLEPRQLSELIEGKFVDALRSVAASMEMAKLHEERKEFVAKVQDAVKSDLVKNGLELESVSLTGLDQTARDFFNEQNAFDAEGLTKLTEEIETRRKMRNDIEQNSRIEIARRKTDADKENYSIEQENESAQIAQQQAIAERRAKSEAEIKVIQEEQERASEEASINRTREIEKANVAKERDIAMSRQDKNIQIAAKTKEEAAAEAEAAKARADAVKAEELVQTARATEVANRDKAIAVLKAEQEAEQEAVGIRVSAQAEKAAADDRAAAVLVGAEAEKARETLRAAAIREVGAAEAEALRAKNDAENSIEPHAADLRIRLELIRNLPKIIEATVRPLDKIESIKILDLDGFSPGASAGGAETGGGSSPEKLVNAALSHRVQGPMIDRLLGELGLAGGLGGLLTGASDALAPVGVSAAKPSEETVKPSKPVEEDAPAGKASEGPAVVEA